MGLYPKHSSFKCSNFPILTEPYSSNSCFLVNTLLADVANGIYYYIQLKSHCCLSKLGLIDISHLIIKSSTIHGTLSTKLRAIIGCINDGLTAFPIVTALRRIPTIWKIWQNPTQLIQDPTPPSLHIDFHRF